MKSYLVKSIDAYARAVEIYPPDEEMRAGKNDRRASLRARLIVPQRRCGTGLCQCSAAGAR